MDQAKLEQIADKAKDSIIQSIDMYISSAAEELGISEEISDSEFQEIIDLILT